MKLSIKILLFGAFATELIVGKMGDIFYKKIPQIVRKKEGAPNQGPFYKPPSSST